MPQNWIPKEAERNFKFDNVAVNKKTARRFLQYAKHNTIEVMRDALLIRIPAVTKLIGGDVIHEIGLIENFDAPHLVYYVKFKEFALHKMTCVSQAIVYNEGGYSGITKHVFFDILLAQYDSIATDSMQSGDGRRFWENQIFEALAKNKFLYYADFEHGRYEPISSIREFRAVVQNREPWGDGIEYQQRRFIICNEDLRYYFVT